MRTQRGYVNLGGLFNIPFLMFFMFCGWLFWEAVFWLISLIPISITFN